ncbi:flagellar hook assembly protein FlgD [Thermocrinis sp.]|jgi:flagellar basal-body rod modification protein FlgD|uniref:flagellar hook assembly protein FlgD n=1 Tax=Thermocrinis sp. TaxID=2024383 RepID=UPI003C0047C5
MEVSFKPQEPKVLPPNYAPGVDSLTSEDFLKIYMETLRYQDPFQAQDLSKMLDDMVKLNQVRFFNDMRSFTEGLKALFNQSTLISSLSLVGKDVIFSADRVNTVRGGQYYLLSPEDVSQATVKFFNGDQVVKEIKIDLKKGLNELDLDGLPRGQFKVKVFKDGLEYPKVQLGIKGSIKAAAIMDGQLLFELLDGSMIDPSKIIYLGGV